MVGIRGEDLVHAYGDGVRGVDGVSVAVGPGELLCVLGPNASGKTTLVRLLAGLLQPQGGRVWMGEDPVASLSVRDRARRVAVVPQSFPRPPALRVRDFVMGGRYAYLRRMRMATEDDVAAMIVDANKVDTEVSPARKQRSKSSDKKLYYDAPQIHTS